MLTVAPGLFKDHLLELRDMFKAHHVESTDNHVEFGGIYEEQYLDMEANGLLLCVSAKDYLGRLQGYMSCILYVDPHNRIESCGYIDAFFIGQAYRGPKALKTIKEMFALMEQLCHNNGVTTMRVGTDQRRRVDPLLLRLGYWESDRIYTKKI